MTDQPARVTPGEISELLDQVTRLSRDGGTLADQIDYQQKKATLLSRIADALGTAEAHEVAAQAWEQLAALARLAATATTPEEVTR